LKNNNDTNQQSWRGDFFYKFWGNMRASLKTTIIIGLATLSFSAFAGQFRCNAAGDAGCAEHIKKIVSDKFLSKFPASKYTIVVIYDFLTYSDGGGVAFSVAGVVPLQDGNKVLVPRSRYISTTRINAGRFINPYQKTQEKIEVIQRSVEQMMEECERSPSCDVMN
jgi:hypothetical protein